MDPAATFAISKALSLVLVVLAFLFFVAPLGIWNRLVEIHRTLRADNKEIIKQLRRIAKALGAKEEEAPSSKIANILCDAANATANAAGRAASRVVKIVASDSPGHGKYSSIGKNHTTR